MNWPLAFGLWPLVRILGYYLQSDEGRNHRDCVIAGWGCRKEIIRKEKKTEWGKMQEIRTISSWLKSRELTAFLALFEEVK